MKNKALVIFFALLFGVVAIYQLSLTFQFNRVENKADEYSKRLISESEDNFDTKRRELKSYYLDSISDITVLNILSLEFTYDELKKNSMKLGLDLKGGINAILQISVKDILKTLSNDKLSLKNFY